MKALNWITHRQVLSALCAAPLLFSSAFASAEDAAPAVAAAAAPAPAYTLTYNLGMYSDYIFRGVSFSNGPALQGGIDWAHSSGFYLGTWFSNLDPDLFGQNQSIGSKGNHVETDFYGGYAHTFANGFGVNFLGNYYKYLEGRSAVTLDNSSPQNFISTGHKQDTFEASVALSYKYLTYTYYNVLTDWYGQNATNASLGSIRNRDTKNSDYHELKVNYILPIADLNFMAKVGRQTTTNLQGDQSDFAIGLNRNFSLPGAGKPTEGFNAGAIYSDTFNVKNPGYYVDANYNVINGKHLMFFVKRSW
jgi:uncharacterized protein (TIGR02001 family)